MACLWALAAVSVAGALAEALVLVARVASPGASPPAGLAARVGAVVFLWFHHAGLVFESVVGSAGSGAAASSGFSFTVALALLGGTVVVLWLLSVGGRAVAGRVLDRGSASGLVAAAHGAKVGLPYAAVCLVVALAGRFTVALPSNALVSGPVRIHPSYVTAFLWPLALGLAAGFVGGLRALRGRTQPEEPWERRARGALVGGGRMAVVGLALSFGGLLVLAAIHPGDTRSYFDVVFRRGTLPGVTLVAFTGLLTPNLAAWVLFPSMGSCLALTGTTSQCLLSYGHFPSGGPRGLGGLMAGLAPAGQGPAPTGYLLFLAIPAVAVVLGGVRAATRGGVGSRLEGAGVGAAAGAVFAVICGGLVFLASISGSVGEGLGRSSGSEFRLGPDVIPSVLLAAVWGVVGGVLGALVRGPSAADQSGSDREATPLVAPSGDSQA